ncbi:hypothetical protein ACIA5C_36070 [Actinoplanes sp. NPDC051343]|uniref:hypothetical protein n=1 Tax=Actinoplanes sp. NPDC051343 TaxID=3363906 RepID=UPI0037BB2B58
MIPWAPAAQAASGLPACVTLSKNSGATILTVTNSCSTTVRVKVVISATTATSCTSYIPGQVRVINVPGGAPSARLEAC